jgi:RNA polymerase sigma factor (sigma-70 family)
MPASDPEPPEVCCGDDVDGGLEADPPELAAMPTCEYPDTARAEEHAVLAALVLRIVHQDESALGDLYRRLSSRVFRQASRLVRDIGTAEEVVEDVFWQVWRQAPRFEAGRGTVIAWVMQIARSRALDALRANGRNPLLMALELDEEAHLPAAEEADPPWLLDRATIGERVQGALTLLDPLRRQLVSLSFERGYSQPEIAEQMGLPLGTVKSHIRRALATMKTTLEGSHPTAPERPA